MDAVAVKTNKFGGVRSSNIELFRILSMLMIVAHHYVVNSGLINCIDAQSTLRFQDYFLLLFGWGGKNRNQLFCIDHRILYVYLKYHKKEIYQAVDRSIFL